MSMLFAAFISNAAGSSDTITLSGTSGSPNVATDIEFSPTDALASWSFLSDGTVDKVTGGQFQAGTEWNDAQPTPSATYYIRAQLDADDAPDTGPTLGSWHALSTTRTWEWIETRNTNGPTRTSAGTLQIDIATDSGGTNIVATGYYRGLAEVQSLA
jgi:hypothetical protein